MKYLEGFLHLALLIAGLWVLNSVMDKVKTYFVELDDKVSRIEAVVTAVK